jgi:hypothetical protein
MYSSTLHIFYVLFHYNVDIMSLNNYVLFHINQCTMCILLLLLLINSFYFA